MADRSGGPNPWVVLLRGVNVGGHNKVPMAELRAGLEAAGCEAVATYIASGNVALRAGSSDPAAVARLVQSVIADLFDLNIAVMVRSPAQLQAAVDANPFPDRTGEPKNLYCAFTSEPVTDGQLDDFDHDRYAPDQLATGAGELYAYYPDGMSRSKLNSAAVDKAAGGPTTARNWNTLTKLLELAAQLTPAD